MENVNKKRVRDDANDVESYGNDERDVKRLREDLLDSLVDSDLDPVQDSTGDNDLASVMKSFEEEIAGDLRVDVVDLTSDTGESRLELGYLLEASDDELGLPPSTASSNDEVKAVEKELVQETSGFGEFWRFDDEFSSFELPEVATGSESCYNNGEYATLDDGLFGYPDVYFESSDFPWRTETFKNLLK